VSPRILSFLYLVYNWLDGRVSIPANGKIFFSTASRPVLWSTQPSVEYIRGPLTRGGGDRLRCEADHTPSSTDEECSANSVTLVRERTVPTERPSLVGEVSANFCGYRGVAWSVRRMPYGRNPGFLDQTSLEH
jgi:hypothetical protein